MHFKPKYLESVCYVHTILLQVLLTALNPVIVLQLSVIWEVLSYSVDHLDQVVLKRHDMSIQLQYAKKYHFFVEKM